MITLSSSGGSYASTILSSTTTSHVSRCHSPSRYSSENSSVFSSSRSTTTTEEGILSSIEKLEDGVNGICVISPSLSSSSVSGSSSPTPELNQSTYSVQSTSTEILQTERPHSSSSRSRCRSQ